MPESIHLTRASRQRRALLFAVTTLVSGGLVAGCGERALGGTTTGTKATTTAADTRTLPTSTGLSGSGSTTSTPASEVAGGSGSLAFARCMRANGASDFPDPRPGGGDSFTVGSGANPSSPAFKLALAKCQKLIGGLPAAPGSTTHPTAKTLAQLVKIASCMRRHGVPRFPDPVTSVPTNPLRRGISEVTDFREAILLFPATINMQAPAYRRALTACDAPPLGLQH